MQLKVHHLNCSSMCPVGAKFMPSVFPKKVICHCLLIESNGGLILVDTGFCLSTLVNPKEQGAMRFLLGIEGAPDEAAINQVKSLGFSPKDVRHIVATHLDVDHCGAVVDFPWAEVHVSSLELQAVRNPRTIKERIRYPKFSDNVNWRVHDFGSGEDWFGFKSVRALSGFEDDLLLIPLFGHTRGHFGVAIKERDRWLLHAGDAYYDHKELDDQSSWALRTFMSSAHTDSVVARKSLDNLKNLKRSNPGIRVFCAHDPTEFGS
ncbi:MAG: MBL fold metallo-hydrolase [Bdellovibrio sp.]|nr:MAG: MBL fold metallo-hydrolase [Bdellovibrio sp.]